MTTLVETPKRPDLTMLSPFDILKSEERAEREEIISLPSVLTDYALVDSSHAEELGNSMQSERGQLTPILVRARLKDNEDKIVYDVIDGFHRTEGRRSKGEETIRATVLYGCNDEELYDLRILAASSVQSVQYPRLAEWMTRSFNTTGWAASGLKVHQAFGVALNDTSVPRGARLTKDDVAELKQWANDKVKRWGKTLSATYQILLVVSNADPDTVKQVRSGVSGGKDRQGKITPQRLAAVVNKFPGEAFYSAQRAILNYAIQERFSASEVEWLVESLAGRVKPNTSQSAVRKIIERVLRGDGKMEKQREKEAKKKITSNGTASVSEPLEYDIESTENVNTLELGLDLEDDEFRGIGEFGDDEELISPIDEHSQEAIMKLSRNGTTIEKDTEYKVRRGTGQIIDVGNAKRTTNFFGGEYEKPEDYIKRIEDLEKALDEARDSPGLATEWWKTAVYLSPQERYLMNRLFSDVQSFEQVQKETRLTELYIVKLIQSAFAKRSLQRVR